MSNLDRMRLGLPDLGVGVGLRLPHYEHICERRPAVDWFEAAGEESWTHDPFDRLIVAHARLRRCRLATADREVLDRLRASERLAL